MHVAYYVGQNVLQNQLQVMTLSCSNNILKIGQVYVCLIITFYYNSLGCV